MKATVAITKMFWEDAFIQDYIHYIVNRKNGFDNYKRKFNAENSWQRNLEKYFYDYMTYQDEWLLCDLVDQLESKENN